MFNFIKYAIGPNKNFLSESTLFNYFFVAYFFLTVRYPWIQTLFFSQTLCRWYHGTCWYQRTCWLVERVYQFLDEGQK